MKRFYTHRVFRDSFGRGSFLSEWLERASGTGHVLYGSGGLLVFGGDQHPAEPTAIGGFVEVLEEIGE